MGRHEAQKVGRPRFGDGSGVRDHETSDGTPSSQTPPERGTCSNFVAMFDDSVLSDCHKSLIHTAWSANPAWTNDWASLSCPDCADPGAALKPTVADLEGSQ